MNPKLPKVFSLAAGLVLVAMATAEVIGNQGAVIIQPADPLLGISSKYIFWGLASLEATVAAICLFSVGERFKWMAIFWLTSYLILLRVCLYCMAVHSVAPYFATASTSFELSGEIVGFLFSAGVLCLWCGSGIQIHAPEPPGREARMARTRTRTPPVSMEWADNLPAKRAPKIENEKF